MNIRTVADPLSNLMVNQFEEDRIEITWMAPFTPPRRGYLLTITRNSGLTEEIFVDMSPHRLAVTPGVYSVQLQALSEHYPSEVVGPVNISVRGESTDTHVSNYENYTASQGIAMYPLPGHNVKAEKYVTELTSGGGGGGFTSTGFNPRSLRMYRAILSGVKLGCRMQIEL